MAKIVISEISANYTYNVGDNSFATVALPITACWGPGFSDPGPEDSIDTALEDVKWLAFPATQTGVERFVSTFRGPTAGYRMYNDYSYAQAMTLLSAGYDVLVCRLSNGLRAHAAFNGSGEPESTVYDGSVEYTENDGQTTGVKPATEPMAASTGVVTLTAKYPGTFGNKLQCCLKKMNYRTVLNDGIAMTKYYWNLITYVVDVSGMKSAVENLSFVFETANATDNISHYSEIDSAFVDISVEGDVYDSASQVMHGTNHDDIVPSVRLAGGTDYKAYTDDNAAASSAIANASSRYAAVGYTVSESSPDYVAQLKAALTPTQNAGKEPTYAFDTATLTRIANMQWLYTAAVGFGSAGTTSGIKGVYDLLKDKLTYNPNRIISPGWDDQNYSEFNGYPRNDHNAKMQDVSPMHIKLMDVAYHSRCATSIIDIPRSCLRKFVYNDSADTASEGYAQMLARYTPNTAATDVNGSLYQTHSALFAPWGKYPYAGINKPTTASPAFLALMIQRAQILNQPMQYEWALPTNRKHNLPIGKMDYIVTKHLLDEWQKLEGVGVNVITNIPDLGTNIWGNSTLYEVPPATYQALANLSTRYLVNAIENVAYRCGLSITFAYSNGQAYNKFYAGVTPILDTMKSVGAIEDYRVQMSADIDSLDRVNANSVIGKILVSVNGVINDIYVDLVCLPSSVDLNAYLS